MTPVAIVVEARTTFAPHGHEIDASVATVSDGRIENVLRDAWSTTRLDAIRVVVQETIGNLMELDPRQILGREPTPSEMEAETGSVRAACDACCDELRDGCGLPTSPGHPAQTQSARATDVGWAQGYSEALEGYRDAACRALESSLELPAEGSSAASAT